MAKVKLDREKRKSIIGARHMVEGVAKADGNEAETRRRVERIFESLMGYDAFAHISREHAVHGPGETEHCDFAIRMSADPDAKPEIMVELKRVNVDLAPKHLKQVCSYAIDTGCEWVLLTNGREWRLYHVSFGRPPETKLLRSWNLLSDDPADLAKNFDLINYRHVKRGGLKKLWEKANVLTPKNVLATILSETSIRYIRRELKKETGVAITPEEVVNAVRKLLNEAAGNVMGKLVISLPGNGRKKKKKTVKPPARKPQPSEIGLGSCQTEPIADSFGISGTEEPAAETGH